MKRLTFMIALVLAVSILSYSATTACRHSQDADAADVVTVTVDIDTADDAPDGIVTTVERTATLVRASVRAGVHLTQALMRSAAHTAFIVARTMYHTAAAIT
jgi:hypothetical protein